MKKSIKYIIGITSIIIVFTALFYTFKLRRATWGSQATTTSDISSTSKQLSTSSISIKEEPKTNTINVPVPSLPKSTYQGNNPNLKKEIDTLSEDLKQNPKNFNKWVDLAQLKLQAQDFEGARFALEYASSLDLSNQKTFAMLADLYLSKFKMYPEAESNFQKAIENDPLNVNLYVSFANMYANYKDKDLRSQAISVVEDGLNKVPTSKVLQDLLASLKN